MPWGMAMSRSVMDVDNQSLHGCVVTDLISNHLMAQVAPGLCLQATFGFS